MTVSTRKGLLPLAGLAAALLLALGLAAATGTPGASAKGGGGGLQTKIYKGTSAKDRGAKLLIKAQVSNGIPKKVTLLRLTSGSAKCIVNPTIEKTVPLKEKINWTFDRYSLPVSARDNPKGKMRLTFELTETNGGAPTEEAGEEELFTIGRFAPNRKSANVSVGRNFFVKGSAVGSKEEFVSCIYDSSFHVELVR